MSLAEAIGLLSSTVEYSRTNAPTLKLSDRFLLSSYDPVKEAERLAQQIGSAKPVLVGLGLGYLAEALGENLAEILTCEGEIRRFEDTRGIRAEERFTGKIRLHSSLETLERALVSRAARSETILFDPSWGAIPALQEELEGLARNAIESPLVMVVLLRTAGDVIRCLAAIQAFKRLQPHARIEFVVDRPYGELARLARGIDRVIEITAEDPEALDERPLLGFNFGGDQGTAIRAARMIANRRPVYSGGYVERDGGVILHDDRMPTRDAELNRYRNHMNRYHLYFAILGLEFSFAAPELVLGAPTIELPPQPYRVAQFGAGSGGEVWAPKRLDPRVIGEALRGLGGDWYAVGADYEAELARAGGIPEERNLCGKTSWGQLAHLLAGAEYYVGHDSGPTHLAAALQIPTLALFGFTSPILNAPIGPRVLLLQADMPCAFKGCPVRCPEVTCTASMTPMVIETGVQMLLAQKESPAFFATAASLRDLGMRFFLPGVSIENLDPLAAAFDREPKIGPPRDPALALLREWLGTTER